MKKVIVLANGEKRVIDIAYHSWNVWDGGHCVLSIYDEKNNCIGEFINPQAVFDSKDTLHKNSPAALDVDAQQSLIVDLWMDAFKKNIHGLRTIIGR